MRSARVQALRGRRNAYGVAHTLLFDAYHWWSGVGNILAAVFMGVLFMLFYQRSGSLWPVVLSHYLTDAVDFA